MIRILLVDDQKTIRESFKAALESVSDVKVVGTAESGRLAVEMVIKTHPDVVLVDMEMPGLDGIATTRIICQQFTNIRVIILSMHDDDTYVAQAVRAGAMGYLIKNTPYQEIGEAIKSVHRGYAQIGPGLLNKIITISAEPVTSKVEKNPLLDLDNGSAKLSSAKRNPQKLAYGGIWLLGNLAIWTLSLLYLKFAPPSYTSSWMVALPGTASSTSVDLPEIGRTSSQNQSPFSNTSSDPRENYKLLANSNGVVNSAAEKLKMTPAEFGQPKVSIIDNSTLIELAMEGDTPQESKTKAIAVQQAFQAQLNRLKNIQSTEPDPNTLKTIDNAKQRLDKAREQLAVFRENSGLNSHAQLENSANSIEQMRIELSQLATQQQRVKGKSEQLLAELKLSPAQAQDALALHGDGLFGQYLDRYNQIRTELVDSETKYLSSHPLMITKQEEIEQSEAALVRRATAVLGRTVSIDLFAQLGLNNNDSQNSSQKENIIASLTDLQGDERGLQQQSAELKRQMTQLQAVQKERSRSGSELDRLKKNVQIAEAVYSSALSQLEINLSNTADIYPPVSVLTPPDLPQKPSSPQTLPVLIGSSLGSFFLTTALASAYWRTRRDRQIYIGDDDSSNGYHKALANGHFKNVEIGLKR